MSNIHQPTLLTKEGLERLQAEYQELKTKKILQIAARIEEAKQQGDLSENAEYHTARDQMRWAQTRLAELELLLRDVVVITEPKDRGEVRVGSKVRVKLGDKERIFYIVGPQETNPGKGYISNESPLGSAFLGRRVGETVRVELPAGPVSYEIIKIA